MYACLLLATTSESSSRFAHSKNGVFNAEMFSCPPPTTASIPSTMTCFAAIAIANQSGGALAVHGLGRHASPNPAASAGNPTEVQASRAGGRGRAAHHLVDVLPDKAGAIDGRPDGMAGERRRLDVVRARGMRGRSAFRRWKSITASVAFFLWKIRSRRVP